jgi:hypothetical protein
VTFSVFAGTSVLEGVVKDATAARLKVPMFELKRRIFQKFLRLMPAAITLPIAWQLVPIKSCSLSMGKSKQ